MVIQRGRFLIVVYDDAGMLHSLARDYDLPRAKALADSIQSATQNQVKVLEETRHGYRIAYTSHNFPVRKP